MTAVFVFRHPQTTWNAISRYQGRLDAPLSDEGNRQLILVKTAFKPTDLSVIYTSPMKRAVHLAEALAERTLASVRCDERLTEVAQGSWEGLRAKEIQLRFPEVYALWYRRPDLVRFPGGETLDEVRLRSLSVMGEIFQSHPDENVGVVTHSVVVQVIAAEALSLPLRFLHNIHVANAGITTICGSDSPGKILSLNVTEPLYGSTILSASAENCVTWKVQGIN